MKSDVLNISPEIHNLKTMYYSPQHPNIVNISVSKVPLKWTLLFKHNNGRNHKITSAVPFNFLIKDVNWYNDNAHTHSFIFKHVNVS